MPDPVSLYRGHRFPREVIAHAVRLYLRFALSFRDVEELLAERGVTVSYETIRRWVAKFGAQYAAELRRREVRRGTTWHLVEMAVRIGGELHWLWRAVDEHGATLDVLPQAHRDTNAAERFFGRPTACGRSGSRRTTWAATRLHSSASRHWAARNTCRCALQCGATTGWSRRTSPPASASG